jgi:hypothetical protein
MSLRVGDGKLNRRVTIPLADCHLEGEVITKDFKHFVKTSGGAAAGAWPGGIASMVIGGHRKVIRPNRVKLHSRGERLKGDVKVADLGSQCEPHWNTVASNQG